MRSRSRWATPAEDLITTLLMVAMTAGLFLDGWSHNMDPGEETFLTPSHYLLYASFTATSLWILRMTFRRHPSQPVAATPVGYGQAIIGMGLFTLGGFGDALWHAVFEFEVSIDALLSPTHVLLFIGGLLIGTSPLRSTWQRPDPTPISAKVLVTPLISMALAAASVGFFFQYASGFNTEAPAVDYLPVKGVVDPQAALGLAGITLTNLILMATLLLLTRRWRVPFGTATLVIGVHAAALQTLREFPTAEIIVGALVAGLVADLLIARLRPSLSRLGPLRLAAATIPIVIWLTFFASFAWGRRVAWPPELWVGVTIFAAAGGAALSLVLAWPGGDHAAARGEEFGGLVGAGVAALRRDENR